MIKGEMLILLDEGSDRRILDYYSGAYRIRIWAERGDLLVSLRHKIYFNEDSEKLSVSFNSFVFNILTLDCCLNDGSLDQIAQSSFNASANIGMSLSCVNLSACDLNGLDSSSGMIAMKSCNSSNIEFICSNCSLEYFAIDCLIFNNSCQQYSGEYNSKFNNREFIIMNLTGLDLKNETKMFVSTTSFIYQPSFFNLSQAFCFISLPNLKQSSSVNSDFSNNLSNFLSNNALLTFSDKNLRTDSDMLSSGNESIFFFSSSGIDNVKFGILIPPHSSVYPVENVQVFKLFDEEESLLYWENDE